MKKTLVLLISLLLLVTVFTGCGEKTYKYDGTTEEFLAAVVNGATATLGEDNYPFSETLPLVSADSSNENAPNYIGLTQEQITQYVAESCISSALFSTSPHQVLIVKCKSAADTSAVATAIASGFDSGRWICVIPDRSETVVVGEYVFLLVSKNATVDALESSLKTVTGDDALKFNVFFTAE
ncbi:MAG: DUF4358 domain-containing protein [Oscillospiraceae bacterium]|jgi:hypothetical protein|nr:DUF4358 domain-containing protein [Oscillospiraceae bacterium]